MTIITLPGASPPVVPPTTIAVIGGGPAGMFFCHALQRQSDPETSVTKDLPATQSQFDVTCFERSSSHGGIWRSATKSGEEVVDMYDQLWMNGPSHLIEMHDYSYDEHFGRPVPVYMKRQEVFDYLTGRVTRDCPDFFEKFFKFRTEVQHVEFDERISKFIVTTKDLSTGAASVQQFDKCVWACGDNGKQKIPKDLQALFQEGGFKGDVIHSANVANFEHYAKDKRIYLIGGAYSAEDLAYQAIKVGAKKVYISTRDDDVQVTEVKAWPGKKVKVLTECIPVAISEDGRGIKFEEVEYAVPGVYTRTGEAPDVEEIHDIDTVIFCTGYSRNYDMLSDTLRKQLDLPSYLPLTLPEGWKPKPHAVDELFDGDVEFGNVWLRTSQLHPNLYNGMLISNPNFIHMTSPDSECVLYSVDIFAHAAAMFVTGRTKLPNEEEIKRLKQDEVLRFFDERLNRLECDSAFYEAVVNQVEGYEEDSMDEETEALFENLYLEDNQYQMDVLIRVQRQTDYPDDIGTPGKLNDRGHNRIKFTYRSAEHRSELKFKNKSEKKWKTFRDCDNPEEFFSLFTGTKAVALERPWMEL